jgi:hypothetical protein
MSQSSEYAERRLVDAETNLARALQRLHSLRRAALAGGYDPIEFDRALVAYRRAEQEALEAREAWASVHDAADGAPRREPDPASLEDDFQPTPRMRFVRWLVENGRLSEWDAD